MKQSDLPERELKRYNATQRIEVEKMADAPSPEPKEQTAEAPAPEVLAPRSDENVPEEPANTSDKPEQPQEDAKRRRLTYRPSHRATFIGLGVVVAILLINVAIIGLALKSQSKDKKTNQDQVTISQSTLDKLGVNRSAAGDLGALLTVGPDAQFNGTLTVGKDVSIAGQLKLNSKFSATDASLTQLEAGNTSLEKLNVNGDSTVSNLNLRKDLLVTGVSRLQGPVTISQLLTVNNNLNVTGSLSIGGSLSVNNFHASTLTLDSNLTIGGHVVTRGTAPSISAGSAVGSNGTVSISGNDASGTVSINIGVGASSGRLASITFRNGYSNTPHVVITPIGAGVGSFYVNRSSSGFNINVTSGLSPGGYAFDYIVEQ